MFDFSFSELAVIGAVALVVIGPERLPRVARTAGHLLGRFQRYVTEVKADINREMELADLKKIQGSVEDAARSIETSVRSGFEDAARSMQAAESEMNKLGQDVQAAVAPPSLHMGTQSAAAAVDAAPVEVATGGGWPFHGAVVGAPQADIDPELSAQAELALPEPLAHVPPKLDPAPAPPVSAEEPRHQG